ncbi:MAG: alpha/beta hydrolase [Betaproteobacteria bacterium]|nr:alpha/beta hydrolase [Betaproteobacteria bacterium]
MAQPVLHFSHANGFPAPCYAAMLAPVRQHYRVGFIEAIGTDPRYPPTEGWPHLVEQLIDTLEREYRGEPVFGVGHSLGAYLNFIAAARRPELFRAIVMLDAPVIGAFRGRALGAVKRLGIVDRVTPAGMTRERRSAWTSREQARAHFASKKLFRHFTDECLEDYVQHGLVGAPGRYRLRIDPEIEYLIYRTIPHGMGRNLQSLKVPAGFIGGVDSDVVRRLGLGATRGPPFAKLRVPGGHLFPFEHPLLAAAAVEELIGRLAA